MTKRNMRKHFRIRSIKHHDSLPHTRSGETCGPLFIDNRVLNKLKVQTEVYNLDVSI